VEQNLNWLCTSFSDSKTLNRIRSRAEAIRQKAEESVGGSRDHIKRAQQQRRLQIIEGKPLQNKYEGALKKERVAVAESRNWMAKEQVPKNTERILFGIRDQTLPLRQITTSIWKKNGPTTCRICEKHPETMEHVLNGCDKLGFTDYLQRHNAVAKTVVASILYSHGLPFQKRWWRHKVPAFIPLDATGASFIRWDPKIPTVERLEHNRPDLQVLLSNGKELLIEIAVCKDDLVADRTDMKAMKYLELRDDLARQHKRHVEVIPIVVGSTGAISARTVDSIKRLNKYGIALKASKVQKTAAIGSANIIRRTLAMC
jgi:hypothetical protein